MAQNIFCSERAYLKIKKKMSNHQEALNSGVLYFSFSLPPQDSVVLLL